MQEISLHLLDLVQNAVEAGADRVDIEIVEDRRGDRLTVAVADNGRGMDAETAGLLADPFYTTRQTRRVGLGVPLLAQTAESTGGGVTVDSAPGRGTRVEARFGLSHLDRPPLGDMAATVVTALVGRPGLHLVYRHRTAAGEYVLDSARLREVVGEVPLDQPLVAQAIAGLVRQGLADVGSAA